VSEPRSLESDAPPAGEELHLPGPSLIPILNAFGISLALFGLTWSMFMTISGLLLFLVTLVLWLRDVRRDIDELPLDHSAH